MLSSLIPVQLCKLLTCCRMLLVKDERRIEFFFFFAVVAREKRFLLAAFCTALTIPCARNHAIARIYSHRPMFIDNIYDAAIAWT